MSEKTRIDKWLWAARFFKTRALATEAIKKGKVTHNDQRPKPSKTVNIGDQFKITQAHRRIEITLLALSSKRGCADIAEQLYQLDKEEVDEKSPSPIKALIGYRHKGAGRPTKRDRREIEKYLSE